MVHAARFRLKKRRAVNRADFARMVELLARPIDC
jgi:hypothetical protein